MSEIVTAGILVIGDEILSGRTKDKNIGFIAEYLGNIGIDLKEVRIVADDEADIVAALNALRERYTYVFTTGGIGPTHDDITADCVAKAFGVLPGSYAQRYEGRRGWVQLHGKKAKHKKRVVAAPGTRRERRARIKRSRWRRSSPRRPGAAR